MLILILNTNHKLYHYHCTCINFYVDLKKIIIFFFNVTSRFLILLATSSMSDECGVTLRDAV